MVRTALYRDDPWRTDRAEVQVEADSLLVRMPGGLVRRRRLHGVHASVVDGVFVLRVGARMVRRFVRMLVLEQAGAREALLTPPEHGAVAPNVVRLPEAPADAAVLEPRAWEALADWLVGGGRLSACSIADLARLACIATPQFAVLLGEVAAHRALELAALAAGPLRSPTSDLDAALQPLVDAAKHDTRARDAWLAACAALGTV